MSTRPSEQTPPLLPQPILRLPFPYKLYKLLDDADQGIHSDIVSWLPQGNGFKIHDSKAFCHTIMKNYFNQSKLKSFTRQLYLYGFLKVSDGPNEGAFFHPKFVRGDREGCLSIRRNQFEGDRRQTKQRTKNLLQSRRIQEASKTTSLNVSGQDSEDGILLGSSSASDSSGCSGTRSSSMQSLNTGVVPPFDNSGEPFKAALTIFDNVFNLIGDEGSCDTPSRNSNTPKALSSSPHSQSHCQLAKCMSSSSSKNNHQEAMTTTTSHLPINRLHPMSGLSWDALCTVNHSRSVDCLPSKTIPVHTTMDTCGTGDDDWLEKLEISLGGSHSHQRGIEEDGTKSMVDLFDFSPRPIEEMCHHGDESHVQYQHGRNGPSPRPPGSLLLSSSRSMVLVPMDHPSRQEEGEVVDLLGTSTTAAQPCLPV